MNLTVLFIILFVLTGIVYDIYIIIEKGKYESISAHVIRGSKKYPLLVLAFGILLGHLFWSMSSFDHLTKNQIIEKCNAYNLNEKSK